MKRPFGGEAAQSDYRPARASAFRKAENSNCTRNQRLALVVTGVVALGGLGALAARYTAPFADPPAATLIETAQAAPVEAATEETPDTLASIVQATPEATRKAASEDQSSSQVAAAPKIPSPEKVDLLDKNDPRWASAAYPQPRRVATTRVPGPGSKTLAYADDASKRLGDAFGKIGAAPAERAPDQVETAAIEPSAARLPTPRPEYEPAPAKPPVDDGDAAPAARVPTPPTSNVTVNDAVNMRSRPQKHAKIVMVVPDNATVGLVDCDGWCEVVYDGRRGYIYKSFIGSGDTATAKPEQRTQAAPSKPKILKPSRVVDFNHASR